MSILSSLSSGVKAYLGWIELAAVVVVVMIIFFGGFTVGEWRQSYLDEDVVTQAHNAVLANSSSIAEAERKARDEASAAYKDELEALRSQNEQASQALQGYQKENAKLATTLNDQNKTIKELRNDKANANYLDSRVPDSIRNGVLKNKAQP